MDEASLSSLASDLESEIKNLNPLNWIHYLVMIGALILLFLSVVRLFPCLFKLLLHSIRTVERDLFELRLKNKKGGDATPTPLSPL